MTLRWLVVAHSSPMHGRNVFVLLFLVCRHDPRHTSLVSSRCLRPLIPPVRCLFAPRGAESAAPYRCNLCFSRTPPATVTTDTLTLVLFAAFGNLRVLKTKNIAMEELDQLWVPEVKDWRLNERHYGDCIGEAGYEGRGRNRPS